MSYRRLHLGRVLTGALVLCALAVGLAGCTPASEGGERAAQLLQGASVEADGSRQVSFPSALFTDMDEGEVASELEGWGCAEVSLSEDGGSYTATIDGEDYDQVVERARTKAQAAIDELGSSSAYPTVTAVDYDEQFSTVTITLEGTAASPDDTLLPYAPGVSSCIYQEIAGLPVSCTVILVGADGSELGTTVFPDVLLEAQAPEGGE